MQTSLNRYGRALTSGMAVCALGPGAAWADRWAPHGETFGDAVAVDEINTTFGEGCPFEIADGLSLLFASNRDGTLDIWTAERADKSLGWEAPQKLPEPINTDAADFCPTPVSGRWLLFVSDREEPEACGGGDIYFSRQSPAGGWSSPVNIGCAPDGPNFPGEERSPSLVETRDGMFLFYSSNGDGGNHDIYVSRLERDGQFGPGQVVRALSTEHDDMMPNVRAAGVGFEIVFNSNRPTWGRGRNGPDAFGGDDIYRAVSPLLPLIWSEPENLGPQVNTAEDEQRATLSADGRRLYFGRSGDVFMSERQ